MDIHYYGQIKHILIYTRLPISLLTSFTIRDVTEECDQERNNNHKNVCAKQKQYKNKNRTINVDWFLPEQSSSLIAL